MTISHHSYVLQAGFVHHWLAAGPQVIPLPAGEAVADPAVVRQRLFAPELGIEGRPVERGPLTEGRVRTGDYEGSWEYTRCQEDHLVQHSQGFAGPGYLRSWAYTGLAVPAETEVLLRLTTPGPADVWVNGERLAQKDTFNPGRPETVSFPARLRPGDNPVFVRFENIATPGGAHFAALQVCRPDGSPWTDAGDAPGITVQIPTLIIPRLLGLRRQMEELFAGVYLERDVFEKDQRVSLRLPDQECASAVVTVRFMTANKVIFNDGAFEGRPGMRRELNYAYELAGGRYEIALLPRVHEYYELNMRIKHELPVWVVGNAAYSAEPYGSPAERRREALLKAATQQNVYGEMAKMALGLWKRVEPGILQAAIERAGRQPGDSALELAGLLGILYRFSGRPEFPAGIATAVEARACQFDYGAARLAGYPLLYHACEILAGQRLADDVFTASGQPGGWHREQGQRQAVAWMEELAAQGLRDWGSAEELARNLVALSLLADLCEDESVQELAQVCMDKLFFTLAVNSYRGLLGSAQRRATPEDLKGGLLQPVAGIARLMWGMGVFNHRNEGYASLACLENYELPPVIAGAAADFSGELWGREQHAAGAGEDGLPVNRVTYRSPDGMLASAQDHCPGQPGARVQAWQATLGPSAVVFTNHPGCSTDGVESMPGFWTGSASLPRVAQWKNVLAAVYRLPEDDWMGFTHAYFPTFAFDEYTLRDGWAFARKGNGYLALACSAGMELVQQGPHALRELRSYGREAVWLCHLGRAAQDGDFLTFQEKILGLPLRFDGLSVHFQTLRGETLSFGAEGPFLVNGEAVPLSGFPHYENPYSLTPPGSQIMDIRYLNDVLRLDFRL